MSTVVATASTGEALPVSKPNALNTSKIQESSIDLSKYRPTPELLENVKNLYKISLTELDCSFGMVQRKDAMTIKQILRQQTKIHNSNVTMLFAIRQPGCGVCREHAMQLADFAARDHKMAVIGAVKETGINDKAILQFFQSYFRGNTLFLDEKWEIFKALGSTPISLRETVVGFFRSQRRFRQKGIASAGRLDCSDNFLKGGVLIFDRAGRLRFYMEVQDFSELSVEVLEAAVAETRCMCHHASKSDTHTISTDQMEHSEWNEMDASESNHE